MELKQQFDKAKETAPSLGWKFAKIVSLIAASSYMAISTLFFYRDITESRKGEKLTDDEIALTKDIFGNKVNTNVVRKHYGEASSSIRAYVMFEDNRNIYFLGEENRSDNYANDDRPAAYKTFAHEMTHIWQNQKQSFVRNIKASCSTYDYVLTSATKFDDLCTEQQASVIGNYAVMFLSQWRNDMNYGGDLDQLRRVVEEKFPAAKLAREKLEQETTPAQEPLSYATQQPFTQFKLNS